MDANFHHPTLICVAAVTSLGKAADWRATVMRNHKQNAGKPRETFLERVLLQPSLVQLLTSPLKAHLSQANRHCTIASWPPCHGLQAALPKNNITDTL